MAEARPQRQLELFDVSHTAATPPHRESLGRVFVSLRHDQVVVGSIVSLLSLAVIFGCGVERGKRLVRSERLLLARQAQPAIRVAIEGTATTIEPALPTPAKAEPKAKASEKTAPGPVPKKAPSKLASGTPAASARSRYAVQVVTYTQPQTAKREMERLHARGERAFLVMRNGRTIVYVGPFPSRGNASEKVTALKSRYQDCFVRTL